MVWGTAHKHSPGRGTQTSHFMLPRHCERTNVPNGAGHRVGGPERMYFPTKYSTSWLAAGQADCPHSLFVPFSPWFYHLLTQTEAKLPRLKAALPCRYPQVSAAPAPCRYFLYGLINSKPGLAGGMDPADPRLLLSPDASGAGTPPVTPG